MGIGADLKLFRYQIRSLAGGGATRHLFVRTNTHTPSLILDGIPNGTLNPVADSATQAMILPLVSRGGSIHPAARVAVIEFTGALPPGLVTRRQSICVLAIIRYEQFIEGMSGTFRGLPVKLVQKIDGRPDINGRF